MDVVLLKPVTNLGEEGQVVKVNDGYARNFLIPGGWAAAATTAELKNLEEVKHQRQRKLERQRADAQALKARLERAQFKTALTLGEDGKPFGAITAHDVFEIVQGRGFTLERHAIELDEPIKSIGVFPVTARLHPDVTATLKVTVEKA